jgi:hypothetical protein
VKMDDADESHHSSAIQEKEESFSLASPQHKDQVYEFKEDLPM